MNFVFHEFIQLSSVINKSEREAGHSRLDRRKGAAMLGLCTFAHPSRPIIRFKRLSKYDFKAVFEV